MTKRWIKLGSFPLARYIEVEKTTEKSVWVKGRRKNKIDNHFSIHPDKESACAYAHLKAREKIEQYERYIQNIKSKLQKELQAIRKLEE